MSYSIRRSTLQIALGVSVVFHGLVAFSFWEAPLSAVSAPEPEAARIAISLVSSAPAVSSALPVDSPRPPEHQTPAAVRPPPPPPPPVPPPERAMPSIRAKPQPRPKPVVEPRPAPVPVPAPQPVFDSVPVSKEVREILPTPGPSSAPAASDSVASTTAVASAPAQRVEALSPDRMPSYVAEVRRRIESKKRYPSLARKRREEGRVLARVSIGSSGALHAVEVEDEAPLSLRRATRAAIEGAAPFPVPPRGEVMVEISILWQVRR